MSGRRAAPRRHGGMSVQAGVHGVSSKRACTADVQRTWRTGGRARRRRGGQEMRGGRRQSGRAYGGVCGRASMRRVDNGMRMCGRQLCEWHGSGVMAMAGMKANGLAAVKKAAATAGRRQQALIE